MSSQRKSQSGFTFIEIASVMAISSLLAVMGMPLVNQFKADSAASGAQQNLAQALAHARTHAVSQGKTVKVCGSSDGLVCSDDAWSKGWLVHQSEQSSAGAVIAAEDIISAYQFDDTTYAVRVYDEKWQAVNEIRFDTQGFNLAQQRLAATVCVPGASAEMDAMLIERTGRVRLSHSAADKAATAAVVSAARSNTFNQCNQA